MKRLRDILCARLRIGAFLLLGLTLGGCGWLGGCWMKPRTHGSAPVANAAQHAVVSTAYEGRATIAVVLPIAR